MIDNASALPCPEIDLKCFLLFSGLRIVSHLPSFIALPCEGNPTLARVAIISLFQNRLGTSQRLSEFARAPL